MKALISVKLTDPDEVENAESFFRGAEACNGCNPFSR